MRYVNILLGMLMAAFAAAFRLTRVRSLAGERLLWLSVAIVAGTTVYYWPTMPGFWRKSAA